MNNNQTPDPLAFRERLFSGVPLYTTHLVREGLFPFPTRDQVHSPADVAAVLQAYYADRDREEFIVCLLDSANTLIGLVCISVGGLTASIVEPRQVFKAAVLANAAAVILAHQHPSGNPEPSPEDLRSRASSWRQDDSWACLCTTTSSSPTTATLAWRNVG